jgi:hypothetical protein
VLRPTAVVGVVLTGVLALTGCSSSSGDVAPSDTASPTSAQPSGSATASASPSTSNSLNPFVILPESELAILPNFAYVAADGQDSQIASQGTNDTVARVFSGAVARQLVYSGSEVGGVQLWRFREDVPVSTKAQLLTFMVGGFGGKDATTGTLNGIPVAQVEQARSSQITAVGFLTGEDMVLVWSAGTEAAQRLSVTYMAAAGIGKAGPSAPASASPSAS